MPIYAKSKPPETLEEHNKKLLENYEKLKIFLDPDKVKKYDTVIKKILYYHDLGKVNHKFQNKLGLSGKVVIPELKDYNEIPHEWLSLAFISKEDKKYYATPTQKEIKAYQDGDVTARKMLGFENRKDHSDRTYNIVELDAEAELLPVDENGNVITPVE